MPTKLIISAKTFPPQIIENKKAVLTVCVCTNIHSIYTFMHVHNRHVTKTLSAYTSNSKMSKSAVYKKWTLCSQIIYMNEALYMLRPHDPRPVTTEKVLSCKYPLDSGTFNLKRAMKPSPWIWFALIRLLSDLFIWHLIIHGPDNYISI